MERCGVTGLILKQGGEVLGGDLGNHLALGVGGLALKNTDLVRKRDIDGWWWESGIFESREADCVEGHTIGEVRRCHGG